MPRSRPMEAAQLEYRAHGLAVLHHMLERDSDIAAPDLQAVYDWCLSQDWDANAGALEEYGPVVALGMALGDLIAAETGMDWVWLEDEAWDWHGAALEMPGLALHCSPVAMMARRLADRVPVRIDALIADTITNLRTQAAAMTMPRH